MIAAVPVAIIVGAGLFFLWNRDQSWEQFTVSKGQARTQTVFQSNDISTLIDPKLDGWDSEVFAQAAQSQLDRLAQILVANPAATAVSQILDADIESSELRPAKLPVAFEAPAGRAIVRRGIASEDTVHRGEEAFAAACRRLSASFNASEQPRVALKISAVELSADSAETTVRYEAAADYLQQSALWSCRWSEPNTENPLLLGLRLVEFEEVETTGGRWFEDGTEGVLGNNPAFHQQLAHGLHHWLGRIDRAHGMGYFKRHGLAVGDANGDGLDDLYLCQAGGLPNRLFLQNHDGTASDVSAKFGVDYLDHTSSALLVDLDNDGDQDLALAMFDGVQVLENEGNAGFVHWAGLEMLDTDLASLSAADYDNDGDLDLYITVDFAEKGAHSKTGAELPGFIYHDANDGGKNVLLQNEGGWKFDDVTAAVGLDANNRRHSLAAAWDDFDRDGDLDLYVANDYGQNCLYRNTGGNFADVATELGVVDYGSGMSVSWGDFDRDGQSDLYVGNMFSNAGNRIARQPEFLEGSDAAVRALNLRFAKGNTLFRGAAGEPFEEMRPAAGVAMGRWAWSSLFADLDNDGWEDLFVANGYLTTPDSGDL